MSTSTAATTALLELTQGYATVIDAATYDSLAAYRWRSVRDPRRVYAHRTRTVAEIQAVPGSETITLHRHLMGLPPGREPQVDHINGNGLDNRRENLRIVSRSQNLANSRPQTGCSSIYKGVCWYKRDRCWQAAITCQQVKRHLGFFAPEDELLAALAYDRAARELFGEHARCNFAELCLQAAA